MLLLTPMSAPRQRTEATAATTQAVARIPATLLYASRTTLIATANFITGFCDVVAATIAHPFSDALAVRTSSHLSCLPSDPCSVHLAA